MEIERLKEDIRNIEYELEYGEEEHLGRIAVDVSYLRSVINFANAAIARQSATSEEVQRAIEQFTEWEMMGWSKSEVPNSHCLKTAITALQAYQPNPTSKVQEAIKQKLTTDAIEYLNKKMKQPFVEKDGERNDI